MRSNSHNARYVLASMITITAVFVFVFVLARSTLGYDPMQEMASTLGISNELTVTAGPLDRSSSQSHTTKASSQTSQTVIPPTYPARLSISSLKIDAKVQYVGQAADGAMAVPTNFTDVAWYRAGTVPGDVGTAVFDGHVDNGLGLSGVFKHLSSIKKGADIIITNKGGKKIHFTVTRIDTYSYTDPQASVAIFGTDGNAKTLRLVTCEGSWVQSDKTYDHRLVVTAVAKN